MKKKIKYTNEPIEGEKINDFLPPPDKLVFKKENARVTITLSKRSVEYFKRWASTQHVHYQTMIREVLDGYVRHHAR